MLLFPYKKEVWNQSVGNALVVFVVVEHNGGSLVLRKEDHECLCKWGGTIMVVVMYELDLVEKLRV